MSTFQHRNDVISNTRQAATQVLNGLANLEKCLAAWEGRGLKAQVIDATGGDPSAEGYKANDFAGHEGLRKADINQALMIALPALRTMLQSADGKKLEDIAI